MTRHSPTWSRGARRSRMPSNDHTVHVDVGGLEPGAAYYYRFTSGGELLADRADQDPARPTASASASRSCSCAKYNAGFFNAYARIAEHERPRLPAAPRRLHLRGVEHAAEEPDPGRRHRPAVRPARGVPDPGRLPDAATRSTAATPTSSALHAQLPIIADARRPRARRRRLGGRRRRARSRRARPLGGAARRGLARPLGVAPGPAARPAPTRTRVFREIRLGGLADIFLLDIRSRRDEPVRDPEMSDPGRSMLGAEQRSWLFARARRSPAPRGGSSPRRRSLTRPGARARRAAAHGAAPS